MDMEARIRDVRQGADGSILVLEDAPTDGCCDCLALNFMRRDYFPQMRGDSESG
jgi:glucose/arabinose dehydrogenase